MSSGLELLPRPFRLDVHARAGRGLADDARVGLAATPKALPPKHFYDERGSELFERITRLPEYYQSRTELRILRRVADGLVARHGMGELVELGSGASRKTAVLLDAMRDAGLLERYVPFDVCPEAILAAAGRLVEDYPGLEVHGVAGDFSRHLLAVPERGPAPRLVAFLGGTIGNLEPAERIPFLSAVAGLMDDDDALLVGTDLAGDAERIRAAYDDAQGVTAAFNLNLLRVLNRELGADFDLDAFEHVARYEQGPPWIEMRLRARSPQRVRVAALAMEVRFAAGEEMRTEISCKFTRETVAAMYAGAGLRLLEWHEDSRGWFAVSLARPA
jgi:L-histidine Nalpha-methyltransferase